MVVDIVGLIQVLDVDDRSYRVIRFDVDEVLQGAAFVCLRSLGNFKCAQPVALALFGEEEQVVVVGGHVEVFDEVFIARIASLRAFAATVLCTVFGQGGTLDVAEMRNGDNHFVVRVVVLNADLGGIVLDVRAAFVAEAFFNVSQLFFDNEKFLRLNDYIKNSGIEAPIAAGIMPVLQKSQVERMIFFGASLPTRLIKIINKYKDSPEDLQKAGMEYACKQIDDLLARGVDGVHIYTMNKPFVANTMMTKYL